MTAGVRFTQVPFRGGGPAVMGVISGHVQFMIETAGGLMPHIQAGAIRALAVTGEHRMAELPEVPTMREAGLDDYVYTTWYALWLPGRTPPGIVSRLNAAATTVLANPAAKAALAKAGVEATITSPERMGEIVHSDLVKWTRIIRDANITAQ
jgi:tripartite-type tricarboxylate transporter receptor subunit TctC